MQALAQSRRSGALPRDPADTARLAPRSACARCAATTGWSTPRRRWPDRRRCWTTWRATRTARPSATSAWWPSPATGCCCGCAPTTRRQQAHRRDGRTAVRRPAAAARAAPGFKRIRHYGLLAPAAKTERLASCAQAAGDAGGQPAGTRGRAGLHAPRGGHRDRVLPALQARPLAAGAALRGPVRGASMANGGQIAPVCRAAASTVRHIRCALPSTRPCSRLPARMASCLRVLNDDRHDVRHQTHRNSRDCAAADRARTGPHAHAACDRPRPTGASSPLNLTLPITASRASTVPRFSPTRFIRRHEPLVPPARFAAAADKHYSLGVKTANSEAL